jgi:hypothetical protein
MCLVVACAAVGAQQDAPSKQPAGPQETPAQFYLRYRSTVQSASNLDEVMRFWQRSLVDGFKQAPPDQRTDLAGFKRIYSMLSDVNVVSVSIATGGSTATMKLAGKTADGKKMSGSVSLVEEDGGWKLAAPEDWQEQSSK